MSLSIDSVIYVLVAFALDDTALFVFARLVFDFSKLKPLALLGIAIGWVSAALLLLLLPVLYLL